MHRIARASLVFVLVACGGGSKDASTPTPEASKADASASRASGSSTAITASGAADAGAADSGSSKPFAGSAAEATQLITDAVDKKQNEIAKCVQQYRFRTHLAHEKVSISMGIDQEGKLIGVTLPKGKQDKELTACVQNELRDAAFPRSHAGVITITRTFQEMVQ